MVKEFALSMIRDIMYMPKSLFMNPSFAHDFAGWGKTGVVSIDEAIYHIVGKSAKFDALKEGILFQKFPIPLGVDWLTELYCWLRSNQTGIQMQMIYCYTDNSMSNQNLSINFADVWEKKVLTPTAGKYVWCIRFCHYVGYTGDVYLTDVSTVF